MNCGSYHCKLLSGCNYCRQPGLTVEHTGTHTLVLSVCVCVCIDLLTVFV